jgi:hypothetical protein
MAYYNTTIYPSKRRQIWEAQFKDKLFKALFDENHLLNIINQEQAICIYDMPVSDLTNEELQIALQAIAEGNTQQYRLTSGNLNLELLSQTGLDVNEIENISYQAKFYYHSVIANALHQLMGFETDEMPTEFRKIYLDYIAKHPEQEQYAQDETKIYFSYLLSLAAPVLRAHDQLVKTDQLLSNSLQRYPNDSPVVQYAQEIRQEVYQLAKQATSPDEINMLADLEATCANALVNPSAETIKACIDKGNLLSNHSVAKSLGGIAITLAGAMIFSLSIAIAVESFGVAAPLSALGMALGESLVFGSLATSSAALGASSSAYGSYMFFKHAHTDPIAEDIHQFANSVAAA